MSQELKLSIVNTPYVNRNVYFKIQFIGLPVPNGTTSPFNIEVSLSNPINANPPTIGGNVNVNSIRMMGKNNDMLGPYYYKDENSQEYLILITNTSIKTSTKLSVIYKLSDKTTLTSNFLDINFIDQPIESSSVYQYVYAMPYIDITDFPSNGMINVPVKIFIKTQNIIKLISIIGSDGSITPVNPEKGIIDTIISITSTTQGPVTYTITGNSDLGIIISQPFKITFQKPLSIPKCPNTPGALVTITSNQFITQINKMQGGTTNTGADFEIAQSNLPSIGLPASDDGLAYIYAAGLLYKLGISSSRVCNAKIVPSPLRDIADTTNVTLSFIITDRITPDNNITDIIPRLFNNDYLSYSCIANWITNRFENNDNIKQSIDKIVDDKGVLPISLQSPSCPVNNSPSVDHFTGIAPYIEKLDASFRLITSASSYSNTSTNAPSNSTNITSTPSSSKSDSSNSSIIIIVVVVVIILAFAGYYYMTIKSKNNDLSGGRFNIGE